MERTWRNFRRRRCCALCPGYGFVAPVSAAPPGRHTGTLAGRQKRKKPIRQDGLFTCLMPGSSLLSHGDPTLPSALRRFTSEFGMGSGGTTALVPPANSLCSSCVFCAHTALAALASVSHILMYAPSIASFAALSQRKILRTLNQS